MKLKDFFTKLEKDGKINSPEFAQVKESAPDFELPDKAVEAFEASYLTIDRAATEKTVHGKIRREVLDPIDNSLKDILTFIDGIDHFKAAEIDKMTSTYDKLKAINAAVPELYEKVKKAPVTDEDTKKELQKQKATVQELMGRIDALNGEMTTKEKHWQKEAEEKINGFRLETELEKLANSFKFGKAYEAEEVRKLLTKGKLGELKAENALSLAEKDGQTFIQVLDKEGKPRFNGNSAVTINQLLEEKFKPFIKANNAGDDDDQNTDQGANTQSQVKRFQVNDQNTAIRRGARTTVVQQD